MPDFMFKPLARNREMTFRSVSELAERFQTSKTAAAIRLVQLGSFPAVVVCHSMQVRLWFSRGLDVPGVIWPQQELSHETAAFKLLFAGEQQHRPLISDANDWVSHRDAHRYTVIEDSIKIGDDTILTLIWWKDESQLLAI